MPCQLTSVPITLFNDPRLDRSNQGFRIERLLTGLVGAGLVGQAEHAFYLWEERERFAFVGLADASPSVPGRRRRPLRRPPSLAPTSRPARPRPRRAGDRHKPDPFHPDLAGPRRWRPGSHVLCEKPLALTVAGCERIRAARDKAGRVVQVAYMKRYVFAGLAQRGRANDRPWRRCCR